RRRHTSWPRDWSSDVCSSDLAAIALAAAERGRRVVLVSTDPAHSLGDALERRLSARLTRIVTRRGALAAVELDADRALERWLAADRKSVVEGEPGALGRRRDR